MNFRNLIAAIFVAATSLCVYAEGYQVNTLSARQNGMGHTGTSLPMLRPLSMARAIILPTLPLRRWRSIWV